MVATPTASGKTLCYNLPVLEAVLASGGKALYLFPTKALAQDQVAELMELNRALRRRSGRCAPSPSMAIPPAMPARRCAPRGDIVVSNPDMLHQAILPHHTKWAQFFEGLSYVVIDELHSYRGVFGSHVANVFRRLRRVCRFYGVDPTFIFASATIANPAELAERLCGAPVAGHHRERRAAGRAPSAAVESAGDQSRAWHPRLRALPDHPDRAHGGQAGPQTIIFARSRLMVEVITKYLKDVFDRDPRRPPRVLAYRGGYLPSERRRGRAGDARRRGRLRGDDLGAGTGGRHRRAGRVPS